MPDIGTYNPYPSTYTSFGKLMQLKKEGQEKSKINYLGKALRFGSAKPGKHSGPPGPG